jgi:ppGpp synthetase/RelA/SpoT-type nucleotidyltranferase
MLQRDLDVFLKQNRIKPEDWQSSNTSWDDLRMIGQDHEEQRAALEASATSNASLIQRFSGVHSVRWRVKDQSHLMAKIVRKRAAKEPKYMNISVENYIEVVDDLIGLRALHLFKSDCFEIDREVRAVFELKENPIAYIRDGDNPELIKQYEEACMAVKKHKDNYRSIHYILTTKPTLRIVNAELQVRTIFEEGWSEIDHKVRYPNFPNNQHLKGILNILNGMAGQADDTGGLIQKLSKELQSAIRGNQETTQFNNEQNENVDQASKGAGSGQPEPVDEDGHLMAGELSNAGEDAACVDMSTSSTEEIADKQASTSDNSKMPDVQNLHITNDPLTILGNSTSTPSEGQQTTLPSAKIAYHSSSLTVAQQALDKHNEAMVALKEINQMGAVAKALKERNVAMKSLGDINQIGTLVKAMDEHNAAMKALRDINQIGAVVKAMDDQNVVRRVMDEHNAVMKAMDDQNIFKKAMEEHNAVKKVLDDHDVVRRVMDEHNAVMKAMDDQNIVKKAMEERNAVKKALDNHDTVKKALKAVEQQNALGAAIKRKNPPYT